MLVPEATRFKRQDSLVSQPSFGASGCLTRLSFQPHTNIYMNLMFKRNCRLILHSPSFSNTQRVIVSVHGDEIIDS